MSGPAPLVSRYREFLGGWRDRGTPIELADANKTQGRAPALNVDWLERIRRENEMEWAKAQADLRAHKGR